jgi:thiol:disulfide interchange protein DsbD
LIGRLRKTLGVLLTMLCFIWLLGIASGGRSLLQPLAHLARANTTETLSRDATQEALARTSVPSSARSALVGDTERTLRADGAVTNNHINQPVFKRVRTVAELEAALAQSARPVMLDFYADWCVSCKEMESFTFTDPNVAARMGQLLLLQADVTANDPDDRALLKRYKLFGPPGIIFFDAGGQERKDVRVVGFQDAKRFASNLDRLLSLK